MSRTASFPRHTPVSLIAVCRPSAFASAGGAPRVLGSTTRYATGRKNALRIELNGEKGSLWFDLERLNELWFHDGTLPDTEGGFRRILVTEPDHPYLGAWWPPGHGLGYEHTFVHQAHDLVHAIAELRAPEPSFADGLVHPTINVEALDPACELPHLVAGEPARPPRIDRILNMSFGMLGINSAVVVGRPRNN